MRAPRIVLRTFGPDPAQEWLRLVRVLELTIRTHCPTWTIDRQAVSVPDGLSSPLGVQNAVDNFVKLAAWNEAVQAADQGDRLLLLDADTMILQPLESIWDDPALDVAITTKPADARFPINAGVVAVRVSTATQAFFDLWQSEDRRLFLDPREHQVWRGNFGGLNQSSLGALLTRGGLGVRIVKLPCREWNAEDHSWASLTPSTRIVHLKGELRAALFEHGHKSEEMRPIIRQWRVLEAAAMRGHVAGHV